MNGHTFRGVCAIGGDCRNEAVKLIPFFLQFLHQTLDGALGEALTLSSLSMAHQTMDYAQTGVVRRWCLRHDDDVFSVLVLVKFFVLVDLCYLERMRIDTKTFLLYMPTMLICLLLVLMNSIF